MGLPRLAQGVKQGPCAVEVGAHAQLKIQLTLARHGRGQVKHAVKGLLAQARALRQQRPGALRDSAIDQQISRRTDLVSQHNLGDVLAGQMTALQQCASQSSP